MVPDYHTHGACGNAALSEVTCAQTMARALSGVPRLRYGSTGHFGRFTAIKACAYRATLIASRA